MAWTILTRTDWAVLTVCAAVSVAAFCGAKQVITSTLVQSTKPKHDRVTTVSPQAVLDEAHLISACQRRYTLVIFTDYECPACRAFDRELSRILREADAQYAIAIGSFPLPQHTNGRLASAAVEAAGQQGRFTEMHKALMAHELPLNAVAIRECVASVGLDKGRFEKDWLESGKKRVEQNQNVVKLLMLDHTPSFVLVRGQDCVVLGAYQNATKHL